MAELEASGWRDTKMLRRLMEYYKDLGFPVATLILGLLGMPVGIVSKRTGRMRGFVLGIFIMVGYYLLNVLGEFSVTTLLLHPFAGAWLPNVLLLLITGLLFYQASRR
jgi:lipopolysaccharide export system permease protein